MAGLYSWLKRNFAHGVHPPDYKAQTQDLPIRRLPFGERYSVLLTQHIGLPATSLVKPGERVNRGQLLAEPGGFVSAALHSPVTGRVTAIAPRRHPDGGLAPAIEIAADPYATQSLDPMPIEWRKLSRHQFGVQLQWAGVVGMGGAAFPSHVKTAPPPGRLIKQLLINGSECEPFLNGDYRLMVERPEVVLRGTEILRNKLGAKLAIIGVELNKPEAIRRLREHIEPGRRIVVAPLRVKYPQGAEKMLIKALFGQEVPQGKLPYDLGMVINNVATMAALGDYFMNGRPLIERVITVAGSGIERPANLLVPIGTPVRDLLNYCGLKPETRTVIMGGPMMGLPLTSLDTPIIKGSTGILAFAEPTKSASEEYACIRCGRCLEACPLFLNPAHLGHLGRLRRYREMADHHVLDCMECGCCAYACPSNIPLVQLMRMAKTALRQERSA